MLKKIILSLTSIIIIITACSPAVKNPVATMQKVNTHLSPSLTKAPTLTIAAITPTDSYLRSISGLIAVMSLGYEKYNNGIGLLNFESGEIQNLLPGANHSLSWSPDGKQIVFDGVVNGFGPSHIFMLNVDDKKLKQLTDGYQGGYGFDWSPNGTQIAYVYENNEAYSDLALFRLSDSVSIEITSTKGAEQSPSFSPDGKTLAYVYIEDFSASIVNPQLMLIDIKSRKSRQVPLTVPVIGQRVSWSPDGKTIAFVSGTFDDDCGDIYFTAPDGSSVIRMTELPNCATQVLWSPDGKYLAFIGRDKKIKGNIVEWGWQIYIMDSRGQDVVQVTHEKDWIISDIDWKPASTCKQDVLGC